MKSKYFVFLFFILLISKASSKQLSYSQLGKMKGPVIFKGDSLTAYRDPAVLVHHGVFYLFFTYVTTDLDKKVYSYLGMSKSKDLINWSEMKILTQKDQRLNFSSPGNAIYYKGEWLLCLQSYPRVDYYSYMPVRWADNTARLFLIRSKDLNTWSEPELLRVKGAEVPNDEMGRMIDPYFIEDLNVKGKWWCFYKQNGVSMSYTYDFVNWKYFGRTDAGENVCVLKKNNEYLMFHSPHNGIGIKRSTDLINWKEWGNLITLGQNQWYWAKGRITAGVVIDTRRIPGNDKYIMFYHGSGPLSEIEGDCDRNASIGIAWSNDLINWQWPGKE